MHIAYCQITKGDDELEKVKRSVASVEKYVDSIHITANHTHKETQKWCKKNGYDFSYKTWDDDFSAQRNFNFSQVPDKTDYIFWMDSDDVLVNGQELRSLAKIGLKQSKDLVYMTYWYGAEFDGKESLENLVEVEISHPRERLIRPGSIKWSKRIHETPVEVEGSSLTYSYYKYDEEKRQMVVLHLGADRNLSEKELKNRTKRNRKLLEKELRDERESGEVDPRTLLYLMKIYVESNDEETLAKAIKLGNDYMQMSGWDEERGVCLRKLGVAYGKLGMHKEASSAFHASLKEWPQEPATYLYLAREYYNVEDYSKMKHWLDLAMETNVMEIRSGIDNLLELKVLSAELGLKYYLNGEKDVEKALEFAEKLQEVNPSENNEQNVEYLTKLNDLNEACRHTDMLAKYMNDKGEGELINDFIESLPKEIKERKFAYQLKNKYGEPEEWEEKEIAYYANFGGQHFEAWSPTSLEHGIGGSETAVIKLAKLWTDMGYKVTVYGDPRDERGTHDGVMYKHWYEFNPRDKFNIFIQWRSSSLAGKIKTKRFFVDLHDIWNPIDIRNPEAIDKIFVKSQYHKSLGNDDFSDGKFRVIGNGIEL